MENKITKLEIQKMFDEISSELNWDISQKEMLWWYFFIWKDLWRLEKLKNYLDDHKYKSVDLYPDDDDSTQYILHMTKVETHSVDSLYHRNEELYQLVEDLWVDSYDGMDVGLLDDD